MKAELPQSERTVCYMLRKCESRGALDFFLAVISAGLCLRRRASPSSMSAC